MTGLETVLGGLSIAVVSGALGKMWGERGTVTNKTCSERQVGCMKATQVEFVNIKESLVRIEGKVDRMSGACAKACKESPDG